MIQNVCLGDTRFGCCEPLIRYSGKIEKTENKMTLTGGATVDTDTYMNLLDAAAWEKYTGIRKWRIVFKAKGQGRVCLFHRGMETALIAETTIRDREETTHSIEFVNEKKDGYYYVRITAEGILDIENIRYERAEGYESGEPGYESGEPGVVIALNICTYKRREYIESNLKQLRESLFFKEESALFGRMYIYVTDNAGELADITDEDRIRIVHNPNTGGSGGFRRGLHEVREDYHRTGVTHVLFMDDDVRFDNESLYRLYALLSHLKPEYKEHPVAGRMFRTDTPWVQYTAAEIWNRGDLRHIGFQQDMRLTESLKDINDNTGAEYGGWWFCCVPFEFARNNDPLPFFLHCDDAEYGLRLGKSPIVLNGIHVWHDTYEKHQNQAVAYYDARNPLVVNAVYYSDEGWEKIFENWFARITEKHVERDFTGEYILIRSMTDFLKGYRYLKKSENGYHHKKLLAIKNISKKTTALMWRKTALIGRKKYDRIRSKYRMLRHNNES